MTWKKLKKDKVSLLFDIKLRETNKLKNFKNK